MSFFHKLQCYSGDELTSGLTLRTKQSDIFEIWGAEKDPQDNCPIWLLDHLSTHEPVEL